MPRNQRVVGVVDDQGGHADCRKHRPHVHFGHERHHESKGRWACRQALIRAQVATSRAARCCWSATTPAATCRRGHRLPARVLDLLRGRAPLSTSSPTTWCSPPRSGRVLRRYGTVAASHRHAEQGARGRTPRCSSSPAATGRSTARAGRARTIDFGGRRGFVRLALEHDVPIVPVVTIGGQETALFLDRGAWLAKLTAARPQPAPQGAADPRSRSPGASTSATCSATSPCRRRSRSRSCRRSTCASEFGPEPDVDEVYEHVTGVMQDALDGLAAERRFPVIG